MSDSRLTPEIIIQKLNLEPLPVEGGFFRRTYYGPENISANELPTRYPRQPRPYCSVIYFFLTAEAGCFSSLHRLPTDEVYHFYLGDPVEMVLLMEDGSSRRVILGQDLLAGQEVQWIVNRGVWQGSHLASGGAFALLGTTMSPAYETSDFEEGQRDVLIKQFPHEKELITKLTRC
jgi:predicted cupin superfamily sugar epimerase